MRREILNTTVLGVFAAANTVIEVTLGTYLHAVKFPLTGAIMAGLNMIPYLLGYCVVRRRGAIFSMGIVTALLNFLLVGGFKLLALPAIVAEAALIDAIVSSGGLRRPVVLLAGIVSNVFSMAYSLLVATLVVGRDPQETLLRYASGTAPATYGLLAIALAAVAVHAGCGAFAGALAWQISRTFDKVISARRRRT